MEILYINGEIKKIYYSPRLYSMAVEYGGVKYQIKLLYDKNNNLKGFAYNDLKRMETGLTTGSLLEWLLLQVPPTKYDYIKKVGEVKELKTVKLQPSKASGAKKGTTMLYLPTDWLPALGLENDLTVLAEIKNDVLTIKRNIK